MKKIIGITTSILGLFVLAGTAQAQAITWSNPGTDLYDDSDVANNGVAFDAATFYQSATVVNGVTFNPLTLSNAFQGGTGTTPSGDISITYDGVQPPGLLAPYVGPSTATQAYVNILNPLGYVANGDSGTVTLSHLTVGDQYQVEVFAFDGLASQDAYIATALSGDAAGVGVINPYGDAAGQYLFGDFTATGGTDSFTYAFDPAVTSGGYGMLNDVVVRDLSAAPEPSEMMLLSIGLLSLVILVRRKQAASL